jgi:hypothetical protein
MGFMQKINKLVYEYKKSIKKLSKIAKKDEIHREGRGNDYSIEECKKCTN